MREEVRRRLLDLGTSDADMQRAEESGWLPLLAFDRVLVPGAPAYDVEGLAAAAGLEHEFARRLWRALGFPDVPAGVPVFTERAVEAARLAVSLATGGENDDALLQQVRVISGSLARIAAIEADAFAETVQELRAAGTSEDEIALTIFADTRFASTAVLIDYVHRLQLRAAIWRRLAYEMLPDLAVAIGFADLSGYTELSAELAPAELSTLVGRWEGLAYDTLAAHGARVVKTIGDEVMFVGLAPATVVAAVALQDAARAADLPPLRIGVAAGPVIPRDGDFYGPVVNLASRLTDVAALGEVLVPADVAETDVAEAAGLRFVAQGPRFLRGIGEIEVFAVHPVSA